ncbi:ATP-binding protein [Pedobacter sp. MR2016-24]|uniref:sensor histidine kinase n=1 Tax=Pedobacter sp. MR2016-24 TaxID=2994466 RepID=UPI0022484A30|nr:ATP-binding protein [Pedobacter sp. MR2016-24]MCX2485069.1 ATP-binding protein [Pedobacter sp. MR2016-24]
MSRKFFIDARLILQLGRDSIKDHTTALVELIKNSFDADASKVEVEIYAKSEKKYIRIADNGFGMTAKEIEDNWLRIGFSEKKKSKISKNGRRKTGEKGIGRIASDRLGSSLRMLSKSSNDSLQGLEVNWDNFDVSDKAIGDIELKDINDGIIKIPIKENEPPRSTGTEMTIASLRTEWEEIDIKNLYQELSYFSPIFSNEFEIEIKNDINPAYSKQVTSAIYSTAEIQLTLQYDGKDNLIYEFQNKINPLKNKTEIFSLKQFMQQEKYKPLECGPIELNLYFFVRKSSMLQGTTFSLTNLKDFLSENYGVKLYRDKVVVKPYGFSNSQFGQDWLGLDSEKSKDPAGLSRESYRAGSNNIVGYAYFTRDENSLLKDSASREGLVENKAFYDLKDLINASITLLSAYRVDINKKSQEKIVESESTNKHINSVKARLLSVVENIEAIKSSLENKSDPRALSLVSTIDTIENVIDETEKTFEDLLEEKRVLSALATLGISSAVFGHETESAITVFQDSASNAKGYLTKPIPNIDIAVEQLTVALKQAKLISSWGVFALSRIEKDKRKPRNRSVTDIIKRVLEQIKPALDALEIKVESKLERVVALTHAMDIESILLNLLTNAFSAVPNSERERKIKILLSHENRNDIKGMVMSVSDSGPGIAPEYHEKIWTALFTTKIGKKERQSGTGLGLAIVKSIVTELEGEITLTSDDEIKGAQFNIWLPRK